MFLWHLQGLKAMANNGAITCPFVPFGTLWDRTKHPTCHTSKDGATRLKVSGGTPPYGYSWSNGNRSASNGSLDTGLFSITIADADGCSARLEIALESPPKLVLRPAATPDNGQQGRLEWEAEGGTPPYTYRWDY